MATEFEVYKDDAGKYRWRLQDDNNRIIADSAEGYASKDEVLGAIPNVQDAAARATVRLSGLPGEPDVPWPEEEDV